MRAIGRPKLQSKSLIASFCKVSPGAEFEILKEVSPKYPGFSFFKALGDFDIVALGEGDLARNGSSILDPGLSSCQCLTAAKWSDSGYTTPNVSDWIAGWPLLGLIALELDKWLYTIQKPSTSISSVIQYFLACPDLNSESLAFFSGFGQSELFVLVRAETFTTIFDLVHVARSAKYKDIGVGTGDSADYAVFSSTHTVPLISYNEVLLNKEYWKILDSVDASIEISCPPGFESEIGATQLFGDKPTYSRLGQTDILLRLDTVDACNLVEKLIEFRATWTNLSPLLVDTKTSIFFGVKSGARPSQYTIERDDPYPPINATFETDKPFIASRITSISHRLGTASNIRSSYPAVMSMRQLPPRLLGEVENYIECYERGGDPTFPYEGTIIRLLENGEIGLAQRIGASLSPNKGSFFIPAQFADGVLASIFAIENFVSFVFHTFSCSNPNDYNDWPGYVFFSDSCGFQYSEGDIFSLPLEAVTSPIADRINWLTLTHEISHAIFTIFDIDSKEKGVIQESACRVRQSGNMKLEEWEYDRIKDEIFELFANWFDYYHFYDRDLPFYQTSVWRSWDAVPFVHKEQIEYIFRSFAIFVLSELDTYRGALASGKEIEYLNEQWERYEDFSKQHIPEIYEKFGFESCKQRVIDLALDFGGPFSHIAENYRNESFRALINLAYPELGNHIIMIFEGEVIEDEIKNPLLLLRECLRHQQSCRNKNDNSPSAALIFSLRNNVRFLAENDE